MMPLTLAEPGEENLIRKVGGAPALRQHLADIGFIPGTAVTVITELGGNIIVSVKDTRIAISREMAQRIMI